MNRLGTQLACVGILAFGALGVGTLSAEADDVLVNGSLEQSGAPPFWTLSQTVTGLPGASVNASEHVPFANNPPESAGLGMLVRPFAGNTGAYVDQNRPINFILTQTADQASITVGNTYTLTGDSFFADQDPLSDTDGYSGGVTLLDTRSPSDPTPEDEEDPASVLSPTQTTFKVEFLDSAFNVLDMDPGPGVVLESVLDVKADRIAQTGGPGVGVANDSMWRTHTLTTPASPIGTRNVRVTVSATNMIENYGFQDLYLDNFTLKRSGAPSIDILNNTSDLNNGNGNLNALGAPVGWTITESNPSATPPCTGGCDLTGFRDFADRSHPNPGNFDNNGKPDAADYVVWRKFNGTDYQLPFDEDIGTPVGPAHYNLWYANFGETATGQQGYWLKAFTTLTPVGDGALSQTVANAIPDAQYTFSAWSAWEQNYSGGVPGTPTQTFIKIEFLNGTTVIGTEMLNLAAAGQVPDVNTGEFNPVDENDWRQFSVSGTAPAGTTHVRVSAGANDMFRNIDPNQSAFFDDFSLIETLPAGSGPSTVPEPAAYYLALVALAGGAWARRGRG